MVTRVDRDATHRATMEEDTTGSRCDGSAGSPEGDAVVTRWEISTHPGGGRGGAGRGGVRNAEGLSGLRTRRPNEDVNTGRTQFIEFQVPAGTETVHLTVQDPQLIVKGPWIMEVPVLR